jgi:rhamnose utilization protein RhaD (predicted bifunctional aldolase and dehydrogenase)/NAD(P)-dependent dehydrogenase (short-subunit alcohol dehydrogenase family)
MINRWSDRDAAASVRRDAPARDEAVALCLYASRLLGQEPSLVLHGGGNTSVKALRRTVLGTEIPAIFVKASGFDMATLAPEGLPALDLGYLQSLRALDDLDDEAMVNELRTHVFDHRSPTPSIETLVHAFLAPSYISHTHADAILALTNQRGGRDLVREVLGDAVAVLDYVEPGFQLAKAAAAAAEASPRARGLVLMHHGLITWGASAREAYDAHIDLVTKAEAFLEGKTRPGVIATVPDSRVREAWDRYGAIAPILRGQLARPTGDADRPWDRVVLLPHVDAAVLAQLDAPGAREALVTPALTTDHLIRTKSHPVWIDAPLSGETAELKQRVRDAVEAYVAGYRAYVERHCGVMPPGLREVDPLPRVALIPGIGAVTAAPDLRAAAIARDVTVQTLQVKARIGAIGGVYEGLPERDLFLMEYRGVQHAKLHDRGGALSDRVAVITGAAGAIGAGIAEGLLAEGCLVALTDLPGERLDSLAASLDRAFPGRVIGVPMDVTEAASVADGFRAVTRAWGGVDLVIVNAGIAHVSPLTSMSLDAFRKLERVNVEGTLLVLAEAGRHFALQGTGGDIVLVSTKNVFFPGATFGAYSATKAASHQLARIASLELAALDVRVNMISPDAVFGDASRRSGLWAEVGPDRMKARGLDEAGLEEYYRTRNLLKARVTAKHCANAVLYFATRQSPTTGATIPVDGGLPDSTPR